MSIRFQVTESARESGIANPVVALFTNVSVKKLAPEYDEKISDLMNRLPEIQELVSSDYVQGFRRLYQGIGSEITPVGENLLKNCMERNKFPRYGNLVDAYNIVALENVTPIGVHDAKKLIENGTLIFRRAYGDEKIVPAFKKEQFTIPKGDFTYGIMSSNGTFDPFAWLGKQDTDSKPYQLTSKSKNFLFTAIGHQETTLEKNVSLCSEAFNYIKMSCPGAKMEVIMPEFIPDDFNSLIKI